MAVYVDQSKHRYGRMVMCHMVADTVAELHAFAALLGLRPEWYQKQHYDICKTNREKALALGALPATSRECAVIRRKCALEEDRLMMCGHNED